MNQAGGKGDKRRPAQVSDKQIADRWKLAFGSTKPIKKDQSWQDTRNREK